MRILVTGGMGDVGRAAVERLVGGGHELRVIGRREGFVIEGAEYRACDINDLDALREQMKGMEAVVHLAAIRGPSGGPGPEIFRVNCLGSYNIYEAAAEVGIRRVVSASSINALGYHFGVKPFALSYFPIDEEHPTFTTDPYSFSKHVLEDIADYYWRREGVSGCCLRLPGVYQGNEETLGRYETHMADCRLAYDEAMALPEDVRNQRVRELIDHRERIQAERKDEWPTPRRPRRVSFGKPQPRKPQPRKPQPRDPLALLFYRQSNFWVTIDARDSAQAIEKSLTADYEGSHPLYINDSHNNAGVNSESLAALFYPDVHDRKRPIQGTEGLVSIDRARALLAFEPEHSIKERYGKASD